MFNFWNEENNHGVTEGTEKTPLVTATPSRASICSCVATWMPAMSAGLTK